MDKLRAMHYFVRLADLGTFTAVAAELNVAKSLISKEIARLEDHLGSRLLQRSTRRLTLTLAGLQYLESSRSILSQMEDAESEVQNLQQTAVGTLRINAPMALGLTDLSSAFAAFMKQYQNISLDIHLGDEPVDLIEQGFDLGFRASSTELDSGYIGRPLRRFGYHICASPEYLARKGGVSSPEDLKQHNCFTYSYFRGLNVWPVGDAVTVSGSLKVNSTPFILDVVRAGLGIGFIPDFVCREALATGDVVEVLGGQEKPLLTLYTLYPARHHVPQRLLLCIEFLERWFADRY